MKCFSWHLSVSAGEPENKIIFAETLLSIPVGVYSLAPLILPFPWGTVISTCHRHLRNPMYFSLFILHTVRDSAKCTGRTSTLVWIPGFRNYLLYLEINSVGLQEKFLFNPIYSRICQIVPEKLINCLPSSFLLWVIDKASSVFLSHGVDLQMKPQFCLL